MEPLPNIEPEQRRSLTTKQLLSIIGAGLVLIGLGIGLGYLLFHCDCTVFNVDSL